MRFVLIRHGQSTNNALWDESGHDIGRDVDSTLTPLGEAQANALAAYATHPGLPWALTHLYASPMARAVQTAAPLADALDLPLMLSQDLFEVGGPYDGQKDTGEQVAHPGSGRSVIAALSERLHLPDWLTEEGWWRGEVERGLEDTEDGVPWDVTAIRINWFPHLAADQVSGSALSGLS